MSEFKFGFKCGYCCFLTSYVTLTINCMIYIHAVNSRTVREFINLFYFLLFLNISLGMKILNECKNT